MAKGQMRSNKEKKKPKKAEADKAKPAAAGARNAFIPPPTNRSK